MYRQKRYDECLTEVELKLKKSPDDLHLLNYQAMTYAALKRDREALLIYQKIKQKDPSLAGPFYNMGIILKRNGRVEEAIDSYKKAIFLEPNYVQAYNNLGTIYKENKEYNIAIQMFTKAIDIQPHHQHSYYNLALIKKEQGFGEEAADLFLKVLEFNPEHSGAKFNIEPLCNQLGIQFSEEGNYKLALKYFKILTLLQPSAAVGFYNMGNTYLELKEFKNAKDHFKKALSLEPEYEPALSNLGAVYRVLGNLKKSLDKYRDAIKVKPDNPKNYYNIAITFKEAGKIEDAEENYRKAINIDPKYIDSIHNLALIHEERGEIKEALNIAKKVWKFEVDSPDINHSIGIMNLQLGHLREGWRFFEYRWKVAQYKEVIWPFQGKPVWKGERDKKVVVWKEQGIGDQIIFLSLVSEVKQICDVLSVYVDPRLRSLCMRAMPDINFIADEKALKKEKCDYHLPIQSLGGLLRNDISDFDRAIKGYLKADPERVESIRNELKLDGKTVVGISWKSFHTKFKTKSIQLRDMERIFSGLDVVLVNLQYGDVEEEIREFKKETGIEVVQCSSVDNREDLDGLAALIEVCDLVVSTSNVTVHLSGALAKETWVLLHYVAIYYWFLERSDSIWYPSLSLYRQPKIDDWDTVFSSIRKDLQQKLINV